MDPDIFTPGKNYTYDLQMPARTGIDLMYREGGNKPPNQRLR